MFEHKTIQNLNEYFNELNKRQQNSVYFYRINGYSDRIKEFIIEYYEEARKSGVIIEGKIPNPDEKNLSYYQEMMGLDFQMSMEFFTSALKKWLPRMNDYQRNNVAESLYDTLDEMRKEGKNDNMLKNAYIKFMCWLYYKFERVVNRLGDDKVPKILYEGDLSIYELKLISILSNAGCDVVILQYNGDDNYLKLDPNSKCSNNLIMNGMDKFPKEFNLKFIQKEIVNKLNTERLYGVLPEFGPCTNTWIKGKWADDFSTGVTIRGNDPKLFYNCFYRINGVEDKLTYLSELFQFQQNIKNSGRKIVIVENNITMPTTEEISGIQRSNYANRDQMLLDLSKNIVCPVSIDLQRLMKKTFIDIMIEESEKQEINVNKLTNKAVYLLCWLKRYQPDLFANWKFPEISCFVYLGGCKNDNEVMFLRFLSRLPIDILILTPNLNTKCCLNDGKLYELSYNNTMNVDKFPRDNAEIHMGTAAFHAERELDSLMYQDTGMFRDQQYGKANAITLQTMYEEISILWEQEIKYRPNFSVADAKVNIPVIFTKVSGVKESNLPQYWLEIKKLLTPDTILIKNGPYINPSEPNPMKSYAPSFFRNGKILREQLKAHSCYQYGFLREDMQEHIFDKLQQMIDQKLIKGTFENGMEYTIIATVLNMNKEIVRMLQRFDFTKKNPKLVYINTSENIISLEDSILIAFLNLVGFDIVFFVPTGYQSVENHYNRKIMEEHQRGGYLYDLTIPDFDSLSLNTRPNWREIIFKRGN